MTRRQATSIGAAAAQPALDRTLTWRLHRLHKLTDLQSNRAYAEHTGMSISDGRCLAAIGSFAPLSVNDLAAHAHLTKGQASRAAQALVDAGLVSKTMSNADGRGVVLSLTAPGKAAFTLDVTVQGGDGDIERAMRDASCPAMQAATDKVMADAVQWVTQAASAPLQATSARPTASCTSEMTTCRCSICATACATAASLRDTP